jgi:PAS domain S-box-containing protein
MTRGGEPTTAGGLRERIRHASPRNAALKRCRLPAGWRWPALLAVVALLSVSGYLITNHTIHGDRTSAAERSAQVTSVRTQGVLGRARAAVVALGSALADEPRPEQARFAQLANSTAGSIDLLDTMWVQRIAGSERASYERRLGTPITRPMGSGNVEPSPSRPSYLVATFTSRTQPELRPGTDVSGWPALAAATGPGASLSAVTASDVSSLGSRPGVYLLEAASFGDGPDGQGVLVAFVPRGSLTVELGLDPQRVAISVNGRRLEGGFDSAPAAGVSFEALAQTWRIAVGTEPASGLQSLLPWVALTWPIAAALIVSLVASGNVRRLKAERYAKLIFDHSLDLLCIAGLDGYFKRVNPAVVRTLGHSEEELLSRPFLDFVHPDDLEPSIEVVEALARGEDVVQFENRNMCRDGSFRWLQWNTQALPEEGLLFCAARDVTDRRRAEDELREAQRMVEASRDELRLLADEQAALRRVATLVASGAAPGEVFAAVTEEARGVLAADATIMARLDPDGEATVVARAGALPDGVALGSRWKVEQLYAVAAVLRTGRPARRDDYTDAPDPAANIVRQMGVFSAVATPIVVDGRLWGALAITSETGPLPADTEQRMVDFTELIGTAIVNTESRAQLIASRARVVAAADETRRRIERDLHDGTQQQLVALTLALRAAEAEVPLELAELKAALGQTVVDLGRATEDLQTMSRGIHPAVLSRGGIGPALRTLARRAGVPVELDLSGPVRLPERAEVAAYYVVSEGLSNAAKHAHASVVHVELKVENAVIEVSIRDDGVGGADPDRGSGLVGLRDRVEALGGTIETTSPPGQGTYLLARIPVGSDAPTPGPHHPIESSPRGMSP